MIGKIVSVLIIISCVNYCNGTDFDEDLKNYLSTNQCLYRGVEQPEVTLQKIGNNRCVTVTDEQPGTDTYFDNERITASDVTLYSVFQGHLNFYNNTPRYCFDAQNKMNSFDLNFDSDDADKLARMEFTPCRTGGFWTNGKAFCSPPECAKYLNQPESTVYFEEELYVTLNMKDIANFQSTSRVRVLSFHGAPDHRFIYNVTANQTQLLNTRDFIALCTRYGPCYKGKFLGRSDLRYLQGGYAPLIMEKDPVSNSVYIGVRNDPRPFIPRSRNEPCTFTSGENFGVCFSLTGIQTWKKLWEQSLPYHKEWFSMKWFVRWSYKRDCQIRVTNENTGETLVDFTGPCGRHVDMKLGNFPYAKAGIYTTGMKAPIKMKYRNIKIVQRGPVTSDN